MQRQSGVSMLDVKMIFNKAEQTIKRAEFYMKKCTKVLQKKQTTVSNWHLKTINGSVPGIKKMTAAEMCAMGPVSVSIHFQQKWNAIFSNLIKSDESPIFGEVSDYFWHIEYQSRGAPHVHCLL